jgi:hypothetical protein
MKSLRAKAHTIYRTAGSPNQSSVIVSPVQETNASTVGRETDELQVRRGSGSSEIKVADALARGSKDDCRNLAQLLEEVY